MLTARRGELVAALGGTGKAEIQARLARMFLRFPSANNTDPDATTAAYATDLVSFPLWAIDRGILRVIETWKSAFAPSSPELRAMVAAETKPFTEELRDLTAILDADVFHDPDETEKSRVLAGFAKLIADFKINEPFSKNRPRVSTKAEAETWLEANSGAPVPVLSDEALALYRGRA